MNILVSVNRKYVEYLFVLMASVYANHPGVSATFYVLGRRSELDEQTAARITQYAQSQNQRAVIIHVDETPWKDFAILSSRWSVETYFRLMPHTYLPPDMERVLYLDVDIVVDKNILDYYQTDFEGNYLVCCRAPKDPFSPSFDRFDYFNAGQLLINLTLFRKNVTMSSYSDYIREHKEYFQDEGILNGVFKGKVLLKEPWNYNCYAFLYDKYVKYGQKAGFRPEARIIHYVAIQKPWDYLTGVSLYDVWWKYARLAPNYDVLWRDMLVKQEFYDRDVSNRYAKLEKRANALARDNRFRDNAINFLMDFSADILRGGKCVRFLERLRGGTVSLLKAKDKAGQAFAQACERYGVTVLWQTPLASLQALSEEEFERCRKADVVVNCSVHGDESPERDGVRPVMIREILKSPEGSGLPAYAYRKGGTKMEHYDIGLLGFWYGINFGSVLTYYALYKLLEQFGYRTILINKHPDLWGNNFYSPDSLANRFFIKEKTPVTPVFRSEAEWRGLNEQCDSFVLGSDVVWMRALTPRVGSHFFFDFLNDDKKRIAYAAAFGGEWKSNPETTLRDRSYLLKFDAVSVRENEGVRICRDVFGVEATRVMDPVFLLNPDFYQQLAERSQAQFPEKYVCSYILHANPDKKNMLLRLQEIRNANLVVFANPNEEKRVTEQLGIQTMKDPDMEDWLKAIRGADTYIGDSYHGVCFSIIFRKNFILIRDRNSVLHDKFDTLLGLLGLENRTLYANEDIGQRPDLLENIDYDAVYKKLNPLVHFSMNWLKTALAEKKSLLNTVTLVPRPEPPPYCDKSVMKVVKERTCAGCGVCSLVCPRRAIEMRENAEGFLNPAVDTELCVNCGLCLKKCPAENPTFPNAPRPECYAMQADDEIRKISSSGGMFTVAAEYVLSKGGAVCGAAYGDDFSVRHIVVRDAAELPRLRGSKYMQSRVEAVYPEIKKLLEEGVPVLFTGCPCQVAGLYAYLGGDRENLYTIDLYCHGISSSKVFRKYHRDVLEGKPVSRLEFKAKEPWGWHAGTNVWFEDGSRYSVPLERDPYFIAYLGSISKNTACGACGVNRLPRQGDLTMGDFWGIPKLDPSAHDGKGTSGVLVNNDKGRRFLEELAPSAKLLKKESLDGAIQYNRIIEGPYRLNKHRDAFFENLDKVDFASLATACRRNRLYEAQKLGPLKAIPDEDAQFYYLARTAVEKSRGRRIVTWVRSPKFEKVLRDYFGAGVAFGVAKTPSAVNNLSVFPLEELNGKSDRYYVVAPDPRYSEELYALMERYGYKEVEDFIFRTPKPIVLDNFDCAKTRYEDAYGNTIDGYSGVLLRVVFRGGNNHIILGDKIRNLRNVSFDLTENALIEIGDECAFNDRTRFEIRALDGRSDIRIRPHCRFTDALFRIYNGYGYASSVRIGEFCTFETKLEVHANSGKKIVIGRDCMFSHGIDVWAGDGHSLLDVRTGRNLNSVAEKLPADKNLLVLGEHVWVGKNAFILHGANVGSGSVIGAMSVEKERVPNNCVVAGNPASIVRRDAAWSRERATENPARCGRPEYYALTSPAKAPIAGLNVLVIGGTRQNGMSLVRELIARGNDVTIATRGRKKDPFGLDAKRLTMDVSDAESVKNALRGKSFDVVFDNLACGSASVASILQNVRCGKYVQLSSIAAYPLRKLDMREEDFNPSSIPFEIKHIPLDYSSSQYGYGKQLAEACAYRNSNAIPVVTVRIPYVAPTDRILTYCKSILGNHPIRVLNRANAFTFIRVEELGKFLPWIAAQDYRGPINLASEGFVTNDALLSYIEKKIDKKAVISSDEAALLMPFNEKSFSLNMEKAKGLGYRPSNLFDWFWEELNRCIERARRESGLSK